MKTRVCDSLKNHGFILGTALKQSKLYFFVFFAAILVANIKEIALVVAPKYIFDAMQFGGSFQAILLPVFVYLAIYLLMHGALYGLTYGKKVMEMKLKVRLNVKLGEKFMKADYSFLEEHKAVEMFERAKTAISGGISDLQTFGVIEEQGISGYFEQLYRLIKDIILLFGMFYVFRYMEWTTLLLVLVCIALNTVFSMIQMRAKIAVRDKAAPAHERRRYCNRLLRTFEYGKEFRVFGMNKLVVSKWRECTDEFLRVRDYYQKRCWIASILFFIVNNGMRFFLLVSLIFKLKDGAISVGDFTMIFTAILTFSDTAQDLLQAVLAMNIFSGFMTDYRKCMQLPDGEEKDDREELTEEAYEIEFKNVWYHYNGTGEEAYALKNINVVLKPGEKISVVGFNGAGKTTFIKLLLGLYEPTKGEILLNGKNRKEYSPSSIKRYMSAVFQDYKIFAMSVEENITLGMSGSEQCLTESMERAGIRERIKRLPKGEKAVIGGFFEEGDLLLSGGESQKIAMARSFFRKTPVIALDEPTSALDVVSEDKMYKSVMERAKDEMILFISHRLASARFCDRILVFDSGEIIEEGGHQELLARKGCYYEMWNVQAEKFNGRGAYEEV
ncbi:MAG: ABC transporter ATP-binding protein [Lachnospiraceae bacterium]|nr:ABC transporter ATP-binding protein [Lachnospiraceae bacterium]